jgi:hypothetical protein
MLVRFPLKDLCHCKPASLPPKPESLSSTPGRSTSTFCVFTAKSGTPSVAGELLSSRWLAGVEIFSLAAACSLQFYSGMLTLRQSRIHHVDAKPDRSHGAAHALAPPPGELHAVAPTTLNAWTVLALTVAVLCGWMARAWGSSASTGRRAIAPAADTDRLALCERLLSEQSEAGGRATQQLSKLQLRARLLSRDSSSQLQQVAPPANVPPRMSGHTSVTPALRRCPSRAVRLGSVVGGGSTRLSVLVRLPIPAAR